MIRFHDVSQLSTAELERAKRELQANLGMITPHSPANVPIQAHIRAIDSELAERAEGQRSTEAQSAPPCHRVTSRSKDLPAELPGLLDHTHRWTPEPLPTQRA